MEKNYNQTSKETNQSVLNKIVFSERDDEKKADSIGETKTFTIILMEVQVQAH